MQDVQWNLYDHLLHMNSMLHWSPCNMSMKGPIFINLEEEGVLQNKVYN